MEYIVLVSVILGLLIAKGIYDKITYNKKLRNRLMEEFGKASEEQYSPEKLNSIRSYYDDIARNNDGLDIDNITWNDLEMDDIFMLLNHTESSVGEEVLYSLLRMPSYDGEELAERERLISFFQNSPKERTDVLAALSHIGKTKRFSLYAHMNTLSTLPKESNWKHYLCIIMCFLSIGSIFILDEIGFIIFIGVTIYNFFSYFKRKGEMEAYLDSFKMLVLMLVSTKELQSATIPELKKYIDRTEEINHHFHSFARNFWLLGSKKPTGDMFDGLMMYIRVMLHVDLIKFNRMQGTFEQKKDEIKELYQIVGYLDACCSIASYRALFNLTCVPEIVDDENTFYSATDLYHPLIENPVANTIDTKNSILITGSNASGKSTFLKSVAVAAIMAQTVHTVNAQSYRSSRFRVFSSMALRDNFHENESYFVVEIKSLKRMMQPCSLPLGTLCFVDEVLRGTNTVERIAASSEVLKGIQNSKTIVFAATHDIELTYLLEKCFVNYHFEEKVTDKEITFDFLLREGRSQTRNAIKLLQMLGYPEELVRNSEEKANHFLSTGKWD